MTNKLSRMLVIFSVFIFCATSTVAQTQELDVELLNKNFQDMWMLRLNNFPKPELVKNVRTASNMNQIGFELVFISQGDFDAAYKPNGITTFPFVVGNRIFFILHDNVADKITAALDPGHLNHAEMQRTVDLGLLAADLFFEMTTRAQRREIMSELERASQITEDKEKDEILAGILRKNFPVYDIVKFFTLLKLRFSELYPGMSIFQTIDFVTGISMGSVISNFLTNNLFGY